MLRRTLTGLALALVLLVAILGFNTLRQGSHQLEVASAPKLAVDLDAAAQRLAGALRFRTVSHDAGAQTAGEEFLKLHAYLAEQFPRANTALRREAINQYSLLYTWPGSDPAARPIMLMAHQDVVPIAPGTEGILKGIDHPVALIGLAEKGSATVALNASGPSGHSSMPAPRGTVGALARALVAVEDHPMPAAIRSVAAQMFAAIAPEMHLFNRVMLSNLWLTGPLVRSQLEKGPSTNAMLRTTTALTVVQGGNKQNVLPGRAQALVNFRLLPGDSGESVLAHVKAVLTQGAVSAQLYGPPHEASPISNADSAAYRMINTAIRATFPGTVVAPGLMIGGTDGRHMAPVADNVYRFAPTRAKAEDLPRFHGTNERMSVANYGEAIGFYAELLSLANSTQ